jgi:threonyl-tRNA synthetase
MTPSDTPRTPRAVVPSTATHHLLLPGKTLPIDAGLSKAVLADLDPATARLVRQRRDHLSDVRTGRDTSRLLERLKLGAEDPGTERGHFQWWPDGVRVRQVLSAWLRRFLEVELGADPIATATLRDWTSGSPLRQLAGGFDDRLYEARLDDRRPGKLTYGGDPGYLSMLRALPAVPARLPWRVYEQVAAHRRCRRSELGGLQRTRSFEFFDFHSLAHREQGLKEYLAVLERQVAFVSRHGHGAAIEVRASVDESGIVDALSTWVTATGRPVVVSLSRLDGKYYRLLHNLYDDRGLHTMHGQLDERNPELWMGDRGRDMSIIHGATGTLERWMLVHLLDAQDRSEPALPDWLAPIQLMLLPLQNEHISGTLELADRLSRAGVRVGVDDRDLTVRRRIRDSVARWVPRTVVVGNDELAGGPMRLRSGGGRLQEYDAAALAGLFKDDGTYPTWPSGTHMRRASEASPLS